jgi:hypothetical protein
LLQIFEFCDYGETALKKCTGKTSILPKRLRVILSNVATLHNHSFFGIIQYHV